MSNIVKIVILLFIFHGLNHNTFACDCMPRYIVNSFKMSSENAMKIELNSTEFIFLAKVTKVFDKEIYELVETKDSTSQYAIVEIIKVWKGCFDTSHVLMISDCSNCSYDFQLGKAYLISADHDTVCKQTGYHTILCNMTGEMNEMKYQIEVLDRQIKN